MLGIRDRALASTIGPGITKLGGTLAAALFALAAMVGTPQAFDGAAVPEESAGANSGWVDIAQGNSGNTGAGKHKSNDKSKGMKSNSDDQDAAPAVDKDGLDEATRDTVAAYFKENPGQTQALPPGIARNVARGKPLPPGIAKRGLPTDLDTELSDAGSDLGDLLEGVIVGDDVVIIDKATDIVVDILKDVVTGSIPD